MDHERDSERRKDRVLTQRKRSSVKKTEIAGKNGN
jgi:hypothetical protein